MVFFTLYGTNVIISPLNLRSPANIKNFVSTIYPEKNKRSDLAHPLIRHKPHPSMIEVIEDVRTNIKTLSGFFDNDRIE